MPEPARPQIAGLLAEGLECWNDGTLDLMQEHYAEDAELDLSAVFTDMPVFRGRESMRRQWDALFETWEGVRMDPGDVFDLGHGRFVVDVRWWGKGKRSGVEVDQRFAYLYTLRDDDLKAVRLQLFSTVEAAMSFAAASSGRGG